MELSASYQLRPLIDNYFDQQICSLNSRISNSLCFLEQYTALPPPPQLTTAKPEATTTTDKISTTPARQNPAKPSRRPPKHLSNAATLLLEKWYRANLDNPYPNHSTITQLATEGNITKDQVKKWFCNKRSRSANTRSFNDIVKLRKAQKYAARCQKLQNTGVC